MSSVHRFAGSVATAKRLRSVVANAPDVPTVANTDSLFSFIRADGAYLWDVDANKFIDLLNSQGSILLGHFDNDVTAAVCRVVASGPDSDYRLISRVGTLISSACGNNFKVAFYHTGTTAVRAVCSAARRATGKRLIVTAGYHGWDPMWQPPVAPFQVNADGVFDCLFVLDELEAFLNSFSNEVAAAIFSPDYIHMKPQTLGGLFEVCRRRGIPVIADEVKNGFRYCPGPSVFHFGLSADAFVFSKGLANGWPLACVVGPDWLVSELAHCCSTLTCSMPSFAAAEVTLKKLATGGQEEIALNGNLFLKNIREVAASSELPIEICGTGTLFQFVFGSAYLEERFYSEAILEGLLFYRGDNQSPSFAFRGEVIDEAAKAFERTVATLRSSFPHLRGQQVSTVDRWRAAMFQMEGFPDNEADPAARRDFIRRTLCHDCKDSA
jgi:glutamate-1-semialdehyde aminotransferase